MIVATDVVLEEADGMVGDRLKDVQRKTTGSILTAESSKSQGAFLARNSVAVAPALAHCTNRTVTAQSTKQENRKMKKRSQDENTILKNTIPARGSSTTLAILLVESR